MKSALDRFRIDGKVAVITGGAGFLGVKHAEAILDAGGIPIIADINERAAQQRASDLSEKYDREVLGIYADITTPGSVQDLSDRCHERFDRVDILINNAANDPKVKQEKTDSVPWSRFEGFPADIWSKDLSVGLTGAFLCSQVFGTEMAGRKQGVILNIASDLGIIAPDQRIYRNSGVSEDMQPVKPVTYSVAKHGLIGLTKYLATYWADKGIRVNALCPGGVYNGQPDAFVMKLTSLIPMGRMADADEYKPAIIFLVSDASSYMTGASLIIDGGRTCW
jgi:NAD(P)-dependent dehydrogenase (short-subunit alcohol dehydrogenase family)